MSTTMVTASIATDRRGRTGFHNNFFRFLLSLVFVYRRMSPEAAPVWHHRVTANREEARKTRVSVCERERAFLIRRFRSSSCSRWV